jgi:hypothetical protein
MGTLRSLAFTRLYVLGQDVSIFFNPRSLALALRSRELLGRKAKFEIQLPIYLSTLATYDHI